MANYYGVGRSNYFRVKDVEAFNKWAGELALDIITDNDLVGFISGSEYGDLPSDRENEATGEYVEIDFYQELSQHLVDDEVAVFVHSGHEKARFVNGFAVAVNSKGDIEEVNLNDIYTLAKKLGNNITQAEY